MSKRERKCKKCGSRDLRKKSWHPSKPQEKHGTPLKTMPDRKELLKIVFNAKWKGVYICMKCGTKNKFER